MGIRDWPAAERPREKLLSKGAAALSDAELLAIFLRTGVSGMDAVELARRLEWTQADVSKCETGVRRLDVIELRIWLKALGYELADFVQALDNSVPLLPDQARNSPAAAQ